MNSKVNKTDEISKEIISEAVREYCQTKNLSQRELATKCKTSDATINNILKGKWEAISEKMWRNIWNVVGEGKTETLFNTTDHASIVLLCDASRKRQLMIGLI